MLYALWDLGFKVGHASRTVEESVRLSREDFTIRTSILEARRLIGDERLAGDLMKRFRDEVIKGTSAEFVAAKLKERDERHSRAGASRYLVEPNIKEGKGGLRDLNTLFWIAQYLHPVETPDQALEPGGVRAARRARLHPRLRLPVGGALPPALRHRPARGAADLRSCSRRSPGAWATVTGCARAGDNTPAVERFMRRYFLIAKEVGTLTREVCAKLEADEAKKAPQGPVPLPAGTARGHAQTARQVERLLRGGRAAERRQRRTRIPARSDRPAAPVRDSRPAQSRPASGRLRGGEPVAGL